MLDVFADDTNFEVLIKPHNADYVLKCRDSYEFAKRKNFRLMDSDCAFLKLLAASDYLITHMSSCVVEAALMNTPAIVIDFDSDLKWPPRGLYNIYNNVSLCRLKDVLVQIKNGTYSFGVPSEARKSFIEYFRFKYDNKSANRIAEALKVVIAKAPV